MNEPDLPLPQPQPMAAASGHMRLEDVTGLLTWVSAQIASSEGRITASIERQTKEADERGRRVEGALSHLDHRVEVLEDRNEQHDRAAEARTKPVKTVAGWVGEHYRDLIILGIAALTAAGLLHGAGS